MQLLLDRAQAARRPLGALDRGAHGDDRLVALALDAAGRLEGERRLRLAGGRDERRLVGLGELGARRLERLRALGGERLGARPGVLERARLRPRALELLLRRGGRCLLRLELGRRPVPCPASAACCSASAACASASACSARASTSAAVRSAAARVAAATSPT